MHDKDLKANAYSMVYAKSMMEDMEYGIRWWIHFMNQIWKKYFNLLQAKTMKKSELIFDAYDVDWQKECQKGNYLTGNDTEGYRYAVHSIVDETEPLYHDEESAWQGLYDHLTMLGEQVDLLPSYEELKWN